MALASGLDSQFGYAEEGTPGTFQTPTRFLEFVDESVHLEIERIESQGIRAARRTLHRWAPGVQRVIGDVNLEFGAEGSGLLLEHMFGTVVSTSGAGDPYVHTFAPADMAGRSMTIQFNRPDITGTDRVFSYTYVKVADWSFEAAVNEYLKLRLGLYGAAEDTGQSLASASYPTAFEPFVFTHGSITVGGTELCVTNFTLNGDNGLKTDRHFVCADGATPKEAIESGRRSYSGTMTADFESLTNYARFTGGTEAALVLTFDRAADDRSLVITTNVRFDGSTPNVTGMETLEQSFDFVCTSGTSDAAVITVALENGDSAP